MEKKFVYLNSNIAALAEALQKASEVQDEMLLNKSIKEESETLMGNATYAIEKYISTMDGMAEKYKTVIEEQNDIAYKKWQEAESLRSGLDETVKKIESTIKAIKAIETSLKDISFYSIKEAVKIADDLLCVDESRRKVIFEVIGKLKK